MYNLVFLLLLGWIGVLKIEAFNSSIYLLAVPAGYLVLRAVSLVLSSH